MGIRRKHSREFKVAAMTQVVEQGRSVSEVADGLGINRNPHAVEDGADS